MQNNPNYSPASSNAPTYAPQPYPPYPPPPTQPPRKKRTWLWIVLGVVAVLVFGCIGVSVIASQGTTAPAGNTPITGNTPASKSTPSPAFASFGDGTYMVGKDIQPGTYRTRTGSPGCYYARLKGFGGTVDDIITNDTTDAPAIVTIAASDKGFQSQNCGTWTKDLSRITASKTSFDDGTFIVGTDITPGTYKNTGGDTCYFARLSGFGGTIDNIITNNNVNTPTIVTISPSDKGFQSRGCGTWTKQ